MRNSSLAGLVVLTLASTSVVSPLASATAAAQVSPRTSSARRRPDPIERALASAERDLAAGRREPALRALERLATRSFEPRAALRLCALVVPLDAAAELALDPSAPTLASRCRRALDGVRASERRPAALAARHPAPSIDPATALALAHAAQWAEALAHDAPSPESIASPVDERAVPLLRAFAALTLARGHVDETGAVDRGLPRGEALARAAAYLELARRARPVDSDVLRELGAVRLAEGDARAAVAVFEALVLSRPGDRSAARDLASARLQSGDARGAVRLLETVAREVPTEARARTELGAARLEAGDLPGAIADARAALALDAADVRPALLLGDALRLQGDVAAAHEAYAEAQRRAPDSARARAGLEATAR